MGGDQSFPSPYGEVGFDQMDMEPMSFKNAVFPSPYGEVGFNRCKSSKILSGQD